jgi:hypothetical protein
MGVSEELTTADRMAEPAVVDMTCRYDCIPIQGTLPTCVPPEAKVWIFYRRDASRWSHLGTLHLSSTQAVPVR